MEKLIAYYKITLFNTINSNFNNCDRAVSNWNFPAFMVTDFTSNMGIKKDQSVIE